MSLDLELTGIDINELNIGSWKPPENKHRGYKDAVVYAVQKDREAREQRIEDNRANLYRRMSPQQRALLEAVARQAQTEEMKVKSGVDTHLEGLADTWAKHAGAILDEPFNGEAKEEPFSEFFNVQVADIQATGREGATVTMERTGTSHDWDRPPQKVNEKLGHRLTDINEEYRQAYCAAHGHRVEITSQGKYWRCAEANRFREHKQRLKNDLLTTYASDEPREPKCCGEGGGCPDCPFRDTSIVSETSI